MFGFGSKNINTINFDKDLEPLITAADITFKLEIENKLEKLKTEKSKLLAELTGSIPEK